MANSPAARWVRSAAARTGRDELFNWFMPTLFPPLLFKEKAIATNSPISTRNSITSLVYRSLHTNLHKRHTSERDLRSRITRLFFREFNFLSSDTLSNAFLSAYVNEADGLVRAIADTCVRQNALEGSDAPNNRFYRVILSQRSFRAYIYIYIYI